MIRNPKHVQKPIRNLTDSVLCNLARQYKENTVWADLIESAANRRQTPWVLAAWHLSKCELLHDCTAYKTLA